MAAVRCENSSIRRFETPATSHFGAALERRVWASQSQPSSAVSRSESTPWCISESITVEAKSPRLSRVRQTPSLVAWTRLSTTTWSWSWGSPSRESKWVKLAATTPTMSSSTQPCWPERV